MAKRAIDTLLALKVFSLVPGLTANDRRVASTLIESFNRRTGRCDPGVQRMANLLGISTRTVKRSTAKLEKQRLFRKSLHGGSLNCNSYEPMWERYQELEKAWTTSFRSKARSRAKMAPTSGQDCPEPDDSNVLQTFRTNLRNTTLKKLPADASASSLLSVSNNSPRSSASLAARSAAERRWNAALHEAFVSKPITYGEVIGAITQAIANAATDAELAREGDGFLYIARQLRLG